MTNAEIRKTIRMMMADWQDATPEQREEAIRCAKEGADRAEAWQSG